MGIIAFLIILWGGTFATVAVDRRLRRAKGAFGGFNEPELFPIIMLGLLLNLACLPYYFWKTRGSALGGLAGFGLFLVILIAGTIANVGVTIFAH